MPNRKPVDPVQVLIFIVFGSGLAMAFLREFESEHYCRAQILAQVIPASSSPSVENVGRPVYLLSDQISFTPPTGDESFHMEAPPGTVMVVREVEYCQMVNEKKKHRWLPQPNPAYWNYFGPKNPLQLSPFPSFRHLPSNFTVGEYSVEDEALLCDRAKFQEWIPDERSLLAFETSEASSFFHYLEDGYFYHNYSEASDREQLWRSSKCVPGDIRAQLKVL